MSTQPDQDQNLLHVTTQNHLRIQQDYDATRSFFIKELMTKHVLLLCNSVSHRCLTSRRFNAAILKELKKTVCQNLMLFMHCSKIGSLTDNIMSVLFQN